MLNRLRRNKDKKVSLTPPAPRTIEEITKEYQQVSFEAGAAQYQEFVYGEQVKNLNQRLLSLNREADARKKLDAQDADKAMEATNESKS